MAKEAPNIASVVRNLGSGGKAPASQILSEVGIHNAAVISKLVRPVAHAEVAKDDRDTANTVNYAEMQHISDFIGKKVRDADNITKLFPDIELAKQIYVSSVIAPKDMTSTEILYKNDDTIFPPQVTTKANESIKANVEGHHKLGSDLQTILTDSLFGSGSYIVATLPESSIDEVINGDRIASLESASVLFNQDKSVVSLGYLSDAESKEAALEDFLSGTMNTSTLKLNSITADNVDMGVQVYDNFNMLKMPRLQEAMIKQASAQIIRNASKFGRQTSNNPNVTHGTTASSLESSDNKEFSAAEIKSGVFKAPTHGFRPVTSIKTKENTARRSIGRALRMKLPSEAVIPVYPPGQPEKHVGYFVLIDHYGAPLTITSDDVYAPGTTGMMNNNIAQNQSTGLSSYLLNRAKDTIIGANKEPMMTDMSRIYSSVIEKSIVSMLKKGLYKKDLMMGESEDIYRIMMYRAFQGKQTRMLYIPADLVTYYAYRYHDNGVGKSLMDDLTTLISTRAVVMVARVMQQIRSSINVTNVGVNLDPKDPDPEKTMQMTVANVIKHLQFQMPIGLITQSDLYEWVARAGVRFTFDNHPGLPELKYEFSNDTIGNTIPDTDLDEDLRRRTYMAFGLSPEQVDNSLSPDFATSVLSSNALLSKRVMNTQEIYTRLMSEDARRILRNDMVAYEELREIIRANVGAIKSRITDQDDIAKAQIDDEVFITELTERYIDSLKLDLPKPDMTTIENQLEALSKAEEIIDKLLESHVSAEAFPQMVSGDASNSIDELKGIIKAAMIRSWLAANPSFKELNELVTRSIDKEGKTTIFDNAKLHSEGFVSSMLKFMKDAKPFANAASRDVENIANDETVPVEPAQAPEGGAPVEGAPVDGAPTDGTGTEQTGDVAPAESGGTPPEEDGLAV